MVIANWGKNEDAHVIVFMKDGVTEVSFYGSVTKEEIEGKNAYVLRPCDGRQKPYATIPVSNVEKIKYFF